MTQAPKKKRKLPKKNETDHEMMERLFGKRVPRGV